MGEHPWITLLVLWVILQALRTVVYLMPNRVLRHWNIHKHGYPPAHCDADGDFKPEPDEDN